MIKKTIVIAIISWMSAHVLVAQSIEELTAHIEEIVQPFADPDKPGISVAIIKDGEIIFTGAHGLAGYAPSRQATEATMYQVDALAKQFTPVAFLHLVESGSVSIEDDVRLYIPELPIYNHVITLNHTTGLNNYTVVAELLRMGPTDQLTSTDPNSIRWLRPKGRCRHIV